MNDAGSLALTGATVTSSAASGTAVVCKALNNVDVPHLSLVDTQIEAAARGVNLYHCAATIRRTSVHAVADSPLFAIVQSTADIDQSSFSGAGVAGETLVGSGDNSFLRFTNSIIGSSTATGAGTVLSLGGCILLSFSTVVNATGQGIQSPAICGGGATANGLCIENSIFVNFTPGAAANTVTGAGAIAAYSIAFPQAAALAGPGNKTSNPMLASPAAGDYHLKRVAPRSTPRIRTPP